MAKQYVLLVSSTSPFFVECGNEVYIGRNYKNLIEKIHSHGLWNANIPVFASSSNEETVDSISSIKDWLDLSYNDGEVHIKDEGIVLFLITINIVCMEEKYPLIICMYHGDLNVIFKSLFRKNYFEVTNEQVIFGEISEKLILFVSDKIPKEIAPVKEFKYMFPAST